MFELVEKCFNRVEDFFTSGFKIENFPSNPDRLGYQRCAGYNREDFQLCTVCDEDNKGYIGKMICPRCGGYGEFPVGCNNETYLTEVEKERLDGK